MTIKQIFKTIGEYAKDKRDIKRLNCMFNFCMEQCKEHMEDEDDSEYKRYGELLGEIILERLKIMSKSYF